MISRCRSSPPASAPPPAPSPWWRRPSASPRPPSSAWGAPGPCRGTSTWATWLSPPRPCGRKTPRHFYAPASQKALAHPEVLAALKEAAAALEVPHHVGVTCTTPDFYAGQGRIVPGFPTLEPRQGGASEPGRSPQPGDGDVRLPHPGGGLDLKPQGRRRLRRL